MNLVGPVSFNSVFFSGTLLIAPETRKSIWAIEGKQSMQPNIIFFFLIFKTYLGQTEFPRLNNAGSNIRFCKV